MSLLDSIIAQHAKDEIPETWVALSSDKSRFGEEALERRLDKTIKKVFGVSLTLDEQSALNILVVEYTAKILVLDLIRPGVDFWSKQVISISAGQQESKSYAQRADELKKMRPELISEIAALLIDIQPLLPSVVTHVRNAPRVAEIGSTYPHLTTDPYDLDPLYGPKEEIAGS
jgi:hypothetical protein